MSERWDRDEICTGEIYMRLRDERDRRDGDI